jgi:hypothetical protein
MPRSRLQSRLRVIPPHLYRSAHCRNCHCVSCICGVGVAGFSPAACSESCCARWLLVCQVLRRDRRGGESVLSVAHQISVVATGDG